MRLPNPEITWKWVASYSLFKHNCERLCSNYCSDDDANNYCGKCIGILDVSKSENIYRKFKEVVDEATP